MVFLSLNIQKQLIKKGGDITTIIIRFITEYWTQIVFAISILLTVIAYFIVSIEGIKCSLRNDILQMYEMGKKDRKISTYQYEAILQSAELYSKLRGNSFVKEIVNKIKSWEVID